MNKAYRLLVMVAALALTFTAEARIYQYVDANGKKVFVDRLSKVPPEFRDQLTSREELKDRLSSEELKSRDNQANQKLQQLQLSQDKNRIKNYMEQWITPYEFIHNRIVVPVKVVYGSRSKNLSLVMDTGASRTVIHREAVASLNPALRTGGGARVADGSVIKTQSINFDRVEIGPYKSKHVQTMILDYQGGGEQSHGLLGMDFLFNAKYELDKVNQLIIWEPELYAEYKEQLRLLEEKEQQLKEQAAAPKAQRGE